MDLATSDDIVVLLIIQNVCVFIIRALVKLLAGEISFLAVTSGYTMKIEGAGKWIARATEKGNITMKLNISIAISFVLKRHFRGY